jgi:hypothetical protein
MASQQLLHNGTSYFVTFKYKKYKVRKNRRKIKEIKINKIKNNFQHMASIEKMVRGRWNPVDKLKS